MKEGKTLFSALFYGTFHRRTVLLSNFVCFIEFSRHDPANCWLIRKELYNCIELKVHLLCSVAYKWQKELEWYLPLYNSFMYENSRKLKFIVNVKSVERLFDVKKICFLRIMKVLCYCAWDNGDICMKII